MKLKYNYLLFMGILIMCLSILCACAEKKDNEFSDTPAKRGDFYTLQEAYDQGLITKADLQNIAYYQNYSKHDESYIPTPKNPAELSAETAHAIKQTYAYDLHIGKKPSEIFVTKYYGMYNDCVAIMIYSPGGWWESPWEDEIDGVIIQYINKDDQILIWQSVK